MKHYQDLVSWQKSMQLAEQVYSLTGKWPAEEIFGLISQIRRAVVSVPSNIAEGYGRESTQDYLRFLRIARGSVYEVETQLHLGIALRYSTQEDAAEVLALCAEIGKMLNVMLRRLSASL